MARAKRYLPVQVFLEWAFQKECAQLELPDRRDHSERGFGFGMEHVLIERAKLGGVQIDGGGPRLKSSHEDAEVAAAAVSNLSREFGGRAMAVKIAELSRAGLTPDWLPGQEPKIEPLDWHARSNGQWQGKTEKCGVWMEPFYQPHPKNPAKRIKRHRRHEIRWTPITFVVTPQQIESAHEEYSRWRRAMQEIRDNLQAGGMLREHEITKVLPPDCPWKRLSNPDRPAASARR